LNNRLLLLLLLLLSLLLPLVRMNQAPPPGFTKYGGHHNSVSCFSIGSRGGSELTSTATVKMRLPLLKNAAAHETLTYCAHSRAYIKQRLPLLPLLLVGAVELPLLLSDRQQLLKALPLQQFLLAQEVFMLMVFLLLKF
jgi:hypothetical protein